MPTLSFLWKTNGIECKIVIVWFTTITPKQWKLTATKLRCTDSIKGPTFNITFCCSPNTKDQEHNSLVNAHKDDVNKEHPQDYKLSDVCTTVPRFVQCYSKTNTAHCTGKLNQTQNNIPFIELLNSFWQKNKKKFASSAVVKFCHVQGCVLLTSKNLSKDAIYSMKQPEDLIAIGRHTYR